MSEGGGRVTRMGMEKGYDCEERDETHERKRQRKVTRRGKGGEDRVQ